MYAQCPKPSKPYIRDANHFLSNKALVKHGLRAMTKILNILKFRFFFLVANKKSAHNRVVQMLILSPISKISVPISFISICKPTGGGSFDNCYNTYYGLLWS